MALAAVAWINALAAKAWINALAAKAWINALAAKAWINALAAKAGINALAAKAWINALAAVAWKALAAVVCSGQKSRTQILLSETSGRISNLWQHCPILVVNIRLYIIQKVTCATHMTRFKSYFRWFYRHFQTFQSTFFPVTLTMLRSLLANN